MHGCTALGGAAHLGKEGEVAETSSLMKPFPELGLLETRLNARTSAILKALKFTITIDKCGLNRSVRCCIGRNRHRPAGGAAGQGARDAEEWPKQTLTD